MGGLDAHFHHGCPRDGGERCKGCWCIWCGKLAKDNHAALGPAAVAAEGQIPDGPQGCVQKWRPRDAARSWFEGLSLSAEELQLHSFCPALCHASKDYVEFKQNFRYSHQLLYIRGLLKSKNGSAACGVEAVRRSAQDLLAVQAAQAGLTNAAARYGTASGAFSLLGPIMWTWLAVDLARQSIGTDFQRVTKAVYALAQVRLLRTHGFINPL